MGWTEIECEVLREIRTELIYARRDGASVARCCEMLKCVLREYERIKKEDEDEKGNA
jgi:hypothetical protein